MIIDKEIKKILESDFDKCVNCKKCFTNCPMMKEFGSDPKDVMKGVLDDVINPTDIAYSCMLCGLCTQKCPKNIDLNSIFYDIRKNIVRKDIKSLKNKNYNTIKFHQINSFSPIFSRSSKVRNNKVLFLPGCSLSSYDKSIVLKSYEYLKEYYDDVSITFNCCGKPTLSMGDIDKFSSYYSNLDKIIKKNNINEIIVACPNCYSTISKNNKDIKVISIYEIISKIGIPNQLKQYYKNIDMAIHDSCSVRKEVNIHSSIRCILDDLGINIIEFKNNRESTVCCGAGGMVGVTNREIALKQMKSRGYETECDNIVCYCESCCESLLNSGKNVLHILDLLFNEDIISNKKYTQSKIGTLDKWKIRYKSVGIIKNK